MASKKRPMLYRYRNLLETSPIEEIEFLANVRRLPNYPALQPFIRRLINTEKELIWTLPEKDANVLAIHKSFSRGLVEGLLNILYIVEEADSELSRRLKKSKD